MIRGAGLRAALAALTIGLCAGHALADEPQFSLAWVRAEGAASCPATRELAAEVAQRLGRDPFASSAERSLEAVVRRDGDLWRTSIHVRDGSGADVGSRTLKSAAGDCGPIFWATVLAIALAIDPHAALQSDRDETASPAPPPAVAPGPALEPSTPPADGQPGTAPATPVLPRAVDASTRRQRTAAALASTPCPARPCPPRPAPAPTSPRSPQVMSAVARGKLALGLLPKPSTGVGLAAGGLAASGLGWTAAMAWLRSVHTDSEDADFGVGLTYGSVEAGYVMGSAEAATVWLSAGLAAGAMHTVVYSPQPARTGDLFYPAGLVGLKAQTRLAGSLVGELGLTGLLPMIRYELRVAGRSDAVFAAPPAALVAHFGFGPSSL